MGYLYALDLSMARTGVVIFDLETIQPVVITSIKTNDKNTDGQRLHTIAIELLELRNVYEPSIVIIERGFTQFNNATQILFRVHGLVNYLFYDIEQIYYPPTTIKATILNGKASKEEVSKKIRQKFQGIKFRNNDESDAFAIGVTFFVKKNMLNWNKK
jgi:Holliday junction resolvasome RuvABC endonuclease subunit